jgi:sulfur carrier protein ThiS
MDEVTVDVRLFGGSPSFSKRMSLPRGTSLRIILRQLDLYVEGCALWWEGEPVPSDFSIPGPGKLEIVRTFSGG